MTRPNSTFTITVSPVFQVFGCPAKLADEARGYFGFHPYHTCPDCRVIASGYEMWGENGHLQERADTPEQMRYWIGYRARQQWLMKSGGIMGYRFVVGQPLYYVA